MNEGVPVQLADLAKYAPASGVQARVLDGVGRRGIGRRCPYFDADITAALAAAGGRHGCQ